MDMTILTFFKSYCLKCSTLTVLLYKNVYKVKVPPLPIDNIYHDSYQLTRKRFEVIQGF
jgi:hypothetical protein